MLILFKGFLNVANEEKFTIVGGKLFQTFKTLLHKQYVFCNRKQTHKHTANDMKKLRM